MMFFSPRRQAVALALAIASLTVGCGAGLSTGGDRGKPEADSARPQLASSATSAPRTTVYFLTEGGRAPIGVRRTLGQGNDTPLAAQAVEALLAGPSAGEQAAGIRSAIPAGVALRSFSTRAFGGTEAVVDLSGLPQGADGVERVRVITQVTRTVVGVSSISRVWLRDDGRPWGLWNMRGEMLDRPHDYAELLAFYRICAAKAGTEAVEGDCFSALP